MMRLSPKHNGGVCTVPAKTGIGGRKSAPGQEEFIAHRPGTSPTAHARHPPHYLNYLSSPLPISYAPTVTRCRPRLWVQNPSAASPPTQPSSGIKRDRPHTGSNYYDSDDEEDDSSDEEDLLLGGGDCSYYRPKKRTRKDSGSPRCPLRKNSVVQFARPLVSAVYTRPRTAPGDKLDLFYCQADQARFREEAREEARRRKRGEEISSPQSDDESAENNEEEDRGSPIVTGKAIIPRFATSDRDEDPSEVTDSSSGSSSNEGEADDSSSSSSSSQSDDDTSEDG